MRTMKSKSRIALTLGATTAVLCAISAPAFAEGSWSSNLDASLGFSSRSWQDSALDNVSTATSFGTCSVSGPGFSSATLNLYDEYGLLPDQSVGSKVNYCGTSDWGALTRSDQYHWTLDAINGGNPGSNLVVGSVYQTY